MNLCAARFSAHMYNLCVALSFCVQHDCIMVPCFMYKHFKDFMKSTKHCESHDPFKQVILCVEQKNIQKPPPIQIKSQKISFPHWLERCQLNTQ